MADESTWLSFEKAVAQIQAQFDANAKVTHNEQIVDRLGHSRQFDVVIRGKFAGQDILGVIECKDTKSKVGSPEVDAFVTKSQDVKANMRMLMSRRGFSKPALEKCAHYGIQALSLLGHNEKIRLFPGTQWVAEHYSWGRMAVNLRFVEETAEPQSFRAEDLRIGGKRVIDWFTNYLLANEPAAGELGWIVNIGVPFATPQMVEIAPGLTRECRAIEFHAERILEKFERTAAVRGTGFYDWNAKRASFVPGSQITMEPVPMDFSQWQKVSVESQAPPGFMSIRLTTSAQFAHVTDAIDLEAL